MTTIRYHGTNSSCENVPVRCQSGYSGDNFVLRYRSLCWCLSEWAIRSCGTNSFTFDVILTAEDEKFVTQQITGNHTVPKFRRLCKLHLTLPKGHKALAQQGCTTSGQMAKHHGCTMSDHHSTWKSQHTISILLVKYRTNQTSCK